MTIQRRFRVFLYATLASLPSAGMAQVMVSVEIHPFAPTASTFNQSQANGILDAGEAILLMDDGADDEMCVVNLHCNNPVGVLMGVDKDIDSLAKLDIAFKHPTNIKIVKSITVCMGAPVGSVFSGCSPIDSPQVSMVLTRQLGAPEGILWMHEYGHNCGLHHNSSADFVMHNKVTSSCKKVTPTERGKFETGTGTALLQDGDEPSEASNTVFACEGEPEPVAQGKPEPVEQFVRHFYFHGVPYEEARKYGGGDVPVLLKMLDDPKQEPYWPNIVTTLGYIGDGSAGGPLIAFFKAGKGQLSQDAYQAKYAVLIHLGDLVNHSDNQAALGFLLENVRSAEPWSTRVGWSRPLFGGEPKDKDDELLTSSAVWGLAMSGKPEALQALTTFKDKDGLSEGLDQVVEEAIAVHKAVEKVGAGPFRLQAAKKAGH